MRAEMIRIANLDRGSDQKLIAEMRDILTKHGVDLLSNKAAALADKCQENAR